MFAAVSKPLYVYSAGLTIIGGGYLLRDYLSGELYENDKNLTDKVIIVTGANTGIGKEIARDLAKREAKVIMACRDMEKCENTRRDIVIESRNKYVYCRPCDLASQKSIRDFVEQFKKEHKKLHILINNAGVMRCPKMYTQEGIELQFGVNHIGHFLLTNLLLDTLKDSAPSRIVNVSSSAHKRGKIKFDDLNNDKTYEPGEAYAQSKLANILFTKELANKLKGTGVTVNAVHPGIVRTEIMRYMGIYQNFLGRLTVDTLTWLFIKTPIKGAQSVLFAALDPSLDDVTGEYFINNKVAEVSNEAKNDKVIKWLWAVSEKWTKLDSV
ncbi:retinol dehydrogenase 13-like isoform X4 [Bombus affinis]|nr:retinol dehydrogenase 13-like isoform X3 [Bombus affinis]XP_050590670.1 retinol dehydrogenase 13-like isoform X4 [Bombus affinis]XP_050590671.1 retinol dehydrogenase 13-like isoform X4 [Bombus affinis]